MSQWAVAEFMSRVANRVSSAGEDLAAQLVGRRSDAGFTIELRSLDAMFPYVEPSPEFVESLRQQLLDAVIELPSEVIETSSRATRRIVYGLAAVGSLASAAVIAIVLYRARVGAQPPAA